MKIFSILFLLLTFFSLNINAAEFRIVHYNIKELDTQKLIEGKKNEQAKSALEVIKKLKPNFLSVNELQYDLPSIPDHSYTSSGKNLTRIAKLLGFDNSVINEIFEPANTGRNAFRMENGSYPTKPLPEFDKYADPVNFGVFPAEYSTGGLFLDSRFKIIEKKVFSDLKWAEFNPSRDIESFTDANGTKLDANSVELFDKTFSDVTVSLEGKVFHIILLHTVPSHDFGKSNSPNELRNADQLSFLEWYLTGSTNFEVPKNLNINPLKKSDLFIAMGDWNTDINQSPEATGSQVLTRLFKKTNLWTDHPTYSYESQPFNEKPYQNLFDYMITSKNISIKGGIYNPDAKRIEKGCGSAPQVTLKSKKIVSYKKKNQTCYAEVSKEYYLTKKASDHRPLWADIEF